MRVQSLLRKTWNIFSGQHVCAHQETPLARPAAKKGRGSSECPYFFGYLTSLDKETPIPQECLTCKEILECKKETPLARPAAKKGRGSSECPYFFGYLTSLDKETPIPQECLTCKEILECKDIWST
jgi:hypothetical protein